MLPASTGALATALRTLPHSVASLIRLPVNASHAQLVTMETVRTRRRPAAVGRRYGGGAFASSDVLALRHRFKVSRVHAVEMGTSPIDDMIDHQPLGDAADEERVSRPVREHTLTIQEEVRVPTRLQRPRPQPTRVRLVDLAHEALFGSHRMIVQWGGK